MKGSVRRIQENMKNNIKTSVKDGFSKTIIQQIVAKALIDAGMMLQKQVLLQKINNNNSKQKKQHKQTATRTTTQTQHLVVGKFGNTFLNN